jgi:pyruvate formate lyase activating enzyme
LDTDVPIVFLEVCVSAKQELTGRIFNIQKYSIYDGDGIRTLVFSKAAIFAARGALTRKG